MRYVCWGTWDPPAFFMQWSAQGGWGSADAVSSLFSFFHPTGQSCLGARACYAVCRMEAWLAHVIPLHVPHRPRALPSATPVAPRPWIGMEVSTGLCIPGVGYVMPSPRWPGCLVWSACGAAAEAGLRSGDVVLAVDGAAVRTLADFATAIGCAVPGDVLGLLVFRERAQQAFPVHLRVAPHARRSRGQQQRRSKRRQSSGGYTPVPVRRLGAESPASKLTPGGHEASLQGV